MYTVCMSKRPAMLSSAIRDIIAPVLRECPQSCGIVSMTKIDVSRDFSYATVYVSALQKPEKALDFLESQTTRLQRMLSDLNRKKIPQLRFRIDRDGEKNMRLEELLR